MASSISSADSSSYTFASLALGGEAANREIVVVVSAIAVTSGATPTATLDGSAMTRDNVAWRSDNGAQVAVFRIAKATGATGTVAVTWNDGATSCAVSVFRMTGRVASPVGSSANRADPFITLTVTVPSGGKAVAGFITTDAGAGTHQWTNATEVYDDGTSSARHSAAIRDGATASVTADYAFNNDGCAMVAVGYGP